jgi:hypothetical protein
MLEPGSEVAWRTIEDDPVQPAPFVAADFALPEWLQPAVVGCCGVFVQSEHAMVVEI